MRSIPAVLLAFALLCDAPEAGQPNGPWVRVDSPRFTVSAELPRDSAVAVARRLEQFRAAIQRVLPEGRAPFHEPTVVVAFATDASFSPFKPGGAARVSGFVVNDEFSPCIALHMARGEDAYRAIFQEYARLLVRRAAPAAPLWFSEGVAEFHSTLGVATDGRTLRLGQPPADQVLMLRRRFVPLRDLFDMTREAANWQGPDGQLFYAHAWALAHYLLANEALSPKISTFLARLSSGAPAVPAFEDAFGALTVVEANLRNYIQQGKYPARDLPMPAGEAAPQATAMSAAQVNATLGRLLFHLGRDAEADDRLRGALTSEGTLFDAHLTMGLMRLRQGRFADAIEPLEKARTLNPGSLVAAYGLASSALQRADRLDDERLEQARGNLAQVLTPATATAEPWAVLGALSGRLGQLEEAERALRRALELSPRRVSVLLELADVCVALEKFGDAERLLDAAQAGAARTGTDLAPWRDRLAREREIAHVRADLAKAAGPSLASLAAQADKPRTGRWLLPPDYRKLAPGEERIHGLLQRIDCEAGRVVVQLATADGPFRLTAKGIVDIQAISYLQDFDPLLSCGVRRAPEPVFATWRPAGAGSPGSVRGSVVALEFLGDEYRPHPKAR